MIEPCNISVGDWLEAEKALRVQPAQPAGTVTVKQYTEMRGIAFSYAGRLLQDMFESGVVTREKFGKAYVYRLKK